MLLKDCMMSIRKPPHLSFSLKKAKLKGDSAGGINMSEPAARQHSQLLLLAHPERSH